jgi:hypothetical protein
MITDAVLYIQLTIDSEEIANKDVAKLSLVGLDAGPQISQTLLASN